MRFENEFEGIKNAGGIAIRINRGEVKLNDPTLHSSETSLDNYYIKGKFDYVINNYGTLEELEMEVAKMLKHFNLL